MAGRGRGGGGGGVFLEKGGWGGGGRGGRECRLLMSERVNSAIKQLKTTTSQNSVTGTHADSERERGSERVLELSRQ